MMYEQIFAFCYYCVNTLWMDFRNAIKENLANVMDDIPVETITVTPEGREFDINSQKC